MSVVSAIIVYILAWWMSLFCILPWGLSYDDNKEPGHMPGAPSIPNLKKKFMITTCVAFVILGLVYALMEMEIINFYNEAEIMMKEDAE